MLLFTTKGKKYCINIAYNYLIKKRNIELVMLAVNENSYAQFHRCISGMNINFRAYKEM